VTAFYRLIISRADIRFIVGAADILKVCEQLLGPFSGIAEIKNRLINDILNARTDIAA
jgi:hypothetical protein